jgi:hypothetical protein
VLLVQSNESFRSSSANPAERRSVEDSFAKSVLWGFTVAAESNGRVLVDATDFFLRDGTAPATALRANYRVDRTRSAFYLPRTKAFPKNTEIEVTLTFANEAAGGRGGGGGSPEQGPPPIGTGGPPAAAGGGGRGRRPVFRQRRQRHTHRRSRHPARALFAGRTARQPLPAAPRRSARRLRRHQLRRLQHAHRRAHGQALHRRHRLEKKDPNAPLAIPWSPSNIGWTPARPRTSGRR